MMPFSLRLAERVVRVWVHLYTIGMPNEIRDSRRAEIRSDLWEEEFDAICSGSRHIAGMVRMLARWLSGIPSDLSWRVQAALEVHAARKAPGGSQQSDRVTQWAFLITGSLLAAVSMVGNASVSLRYLITMNKAEPDWATAILLLNGLAILAGLRLIRGYPLAGGVAVLVASFVFSMAWYWTILGPVLAFILAVLGVRMARNEARARRATSGK